MASTFGFNDAQLRRSTPRQFTAWRGRYQLAGDPAHHWRECQIVDVSATGAGLLLASATPIEVRNRRLVLSMQMPAMVKNVTDGQPGVRVGIEFLDISEDERAELQNMSRMGVRW